MTIELLFHKKCMDKALDFIEEKLGHEIDGCELKLIAVITDDTNTWECIIDSNNNTAKAIVGQDVSTSELTSEDMASLGLTNLDNLNSSKSTHNETQKKASHIDEPKTKRMIARLIENNQRIIDRYTSKGNIEAAQRYIDWGEKMKQALGAPSQ